MKVGVYFADDTGMWDDSQLEHLMSENPNKVDLMLDAALVKPPPAVHPTSIKQELFKTPTANAYNPAPTSNSLPASNAAPVHPASYQDRENHSPVSPRMTTRSSAKSPFRKVATNNNNNNNNNNAWRRTPQTSGVRCSNGE